MRFVSHKVSIKLSAFFFVLLMLVAGSISQASGQTAPYILPYTMSTFAGPVGTPPAIGTNCGSYVLLGPTVSSPNYVALDVISDGCQAATVPNGPNSISVGNDPHDIRVDAMGNIFWADNTVKDEVHKISGSTGLETVYAGSSANASVCAAGNSKDGYNCTATDGAANANSTHYSGNFGTIRGIGVAPNGDVFISDYSNDIADRIPAPSIVTGAAATGVMALVAGTSASAGYSDGPVGSSKVNQPRGIGADPNTGTIYIADTTNDILRKVVYTSGAGYTVSSITALGGAAGSGSAGCTAAPYTKNITNGPASSAMVCAPEDAQVDLNGNVYIADGGNNVIREIYNGSGTVPGINNPIPGWIYVIAGGATPATGYPVATPVVPPVYTYPTDGTTPPVLGTSVAIGVRKLGVDSLGNVYIADSTWNVIWFLDHATGYMRVLAGRYGAPGPYPNNAAGSTVPAAQQNITGLPGYGCPADPASATSVGDGCPGPEASIYISAGANGANSPDNQGNLYISDSEGSKTPATARIRKLLSGLNFPPTTLSTPATQQTVFVHFATGDTAAATKPFVSSGTDFVVGTPNCPAVNADNTSDCYLPIVFTPTKAGYDTATLTITSALGGVNSYLLTGTGTAPSFAIDPGTTSLLSTPSATSNAQGVAFDGVGNAYVADTGNNRVLFYSAANNTTTVFAGTGTAGYSGDSHQASLATLSGPSAVTVGTDGAVYIADTGNNVIRKVNAGGIITTFGGGGSGCSTTNPNPNNTNPTYAAIGDGCPAVNATLKAPSGIVADNLGNIYVSDTGNNLIREINTLGWITTIAGGSTGCGDLDTCSGLNTSFNHPTGLAFDKTGSFLIVADTGDYLVRKIALSNMFTATAGVASNILINGVTPIAGDGTFATTLGTTALSSALKTPTGVAVDAAENVYIADAGSQAVYLLNVTSANKAQGTLSVIVGINGSAGTGTLGLASTVQLNAPASVAISSNGSLLIADSGNNRILSDERAQISFDMGRFNLGSSSPTQIFTELNIGNVTTALSSPLYTPTGSGGTQFTLTSPSADGCVAGESLAPSASCTLQAQFNPTSAGSFSETFTAGPTNPASAGGGASITLSGVGAVLTPTLSTVAQTAPATGNSQYGASVTFGVSVAPTAAAGCNPGAPSCYPSGTVRIIIGTTPTNGTAGTPLTLSSTGTASQVVTGLAAGPYYLSCSYGGDTFYAASTCANVTITVAPASTTSVLAISNNNQPQFTSTSFSATVTSNTSGIPTGTVTFSASGATIGTATVNSGVATLVLSASYDVNGNFESTTTLPPGTYQVTCAYSGSANFAISNCAPMSYTVAPAPAGFNPITPVGTTFVGTLLALPCPAVDLYIAGTTIPGYDVPCGTNISYTPAAGSIPTVSTADGSTTDATIFFSPTNTTTGTLTFSCTGLPATTTCTFSPSSLTLTASAGYVNPYAVDVTFWTDLQPTAALHRPSGAHGRATGVYAAMIGWPMALFGLAALLFLRRRGGVRKGLSLLAMLLIMAGSSLALSGCAGPGTYKPSLTAAGTYPITITVTAPGGASASAVVNFKVAAPGITGQE